jgi:hypothetical protein
MAASFGLAARQDGTGPELIVGVGSAPQGWAVTAWLVSHAADYGIHNVRYQGYEWQGFSGPGRWTAEPDGLRAASHTASVEFG